jgi:hypothetical protein
MVNGTCKMLNLTLSPVQKSKRAKQHSARYAPTQSWFLTMRMEQIRIFNLEHDTCRPSHQTQLETSWFIATEFKPCELWLGIWAHLQRAGRGWMRTAGSVRVRPWSGCRERRAGEARAAAACGVRCGWDVADRDVARQGARVIPSVGWAGCGCFRGLNW